MANTKRAKPLVKPGKRQVKAGRSIAGKMRTANSRARAKRK